jgi:surface polysaccharide O-acyltransferase-like enzyme
MEKQVVVRDAEEGTIALDASRPVSAAAAVQTKATTRLLFIDNIRVFLTILVILHHLMVTYAGTGSWYYNEGRDDAFTRFFGGWFCSVAQAYFMGLFLLISAYFVPGSYDRKGPGRFVKDRLIRLGIPLAVFSWVLHPLFVYGGLSLADNLRMPMWRFFATEYFTTYGQPVIGAGPLWFVETLLIFSLVYVLWRLVFRSRPAQAAVEAPFPGNGAIALFALLLGVAGFLVRLVFIRDEYFFKPLNLQFPFFAPYIALFVLGLIAYRRNWLLNLPDRTGRLWLGIAALFVLLGLGIQWAMESGAMSGELAKGGWHWESLVYALWESFLCMSMCIGVIYAFRRYLDRRGKLAGFLVPNAYTAYIIHALVITSVAFIARDLLPLYPLLKWVVVALVSVPLCFGLSALIRKIPYTDRVL